MLYPTELQARRGVTVHHVVDAVHDGYFRVTSTARESFDGGVEVRRAPNFLDRQQVHAGHGKPAGERVAVRVPNVVVEAAGILVGLPERRLGLLEGRWGRTPSTAAA